MAWYDDLARSLGLGPADYETLRRTRNPGAIGANGGPLNQVPGDMGQRQVPAEGLGQNPWGQGYIPQGYGPSDLQAQSPPPEAEKKKSSLLGRLFGADQGLTEEDRDRLNLLDSSLMRIGTAFDGVGGKDGQPFSHPYNGANFQLQESPSQSALAQLLQTLNSQRRL